MPKLYCGKRCNFWWCADQNYCFDNHVKQEPTLPTQKLFILEKKRKSVFEKTSGICYLCGKPVKYDNFSIDHFIPKSKGGSNHYSNLYPTHKKCNHLKKDHIIDFPIDNLTNKTQPSTPTIRKTDT